MRRATACAICRIFAPWLALYWWQSAPERALRHAFAARPLIEHSLSEHEKLMTESGALPLMRRTGWLKLFRSERTFAAGQAAAQKILPYGLKVALYDSEALRALEPALNGVHGAVHYLDPASIDDPLALTQSYLALFERRGGVFLRGDAKSLRPASAGYGVETEQGPVLAGEAVVCLGPWADIVLGPLGLASRSPSSAAITCITRRARRSIIRRSTPTTVSCSRRWRAESA